MAVIYIVQYSYNISIKQTVLALWIFTDHNGVYFVLFICLHSGIFVTQQQRDIVLGQENKTTLSLPICPWFFILFSMNHPQLSVYIYATFSEIYQSFLFPTFSDKTCKDIHFHKSYHPFFYIHHVVLILFYDYFRSGGLDPGHSCICTESRLYRLQRPKRQGCLTCGEWVCVWQVKRYWFALKRAAHTHRERHRERTRWAGTCIQLFGNKRVRASFVNQTSTLYNDHELHSFDWPVMRSTYNALLLVGM